MNMEWKIIRETKNNYEVNKEGQIRRVDTKHIIKPRTDKTGWKYFNFCIASKRKRIGYNKIMKEYWGKE